MDDQYLTVKMPCPSCNNLNRRARRACKRCNHTGYIGEKKIKQEEGKPITFGGIDVPERKSEFDVDLPLQTVANWVPDARSLRR